MGFSKFLSPRQIKLARGTARDLKLEPAAAGTAKFSFTLERLRFAGNLDLKRDGLYLPIREGDELAVIYDRRVLDKRLNHRHGELKFQPRSFEGLEFLPQRFKRRRFKRRKLRAAL